MVDVNIPNKEKEKLPILLVDDDQNLTNALRLILRKNYSIQTANSIEEAAKTLLNNEFPLIILDYELGDRIDGVVFSKHIRNLYPLTYIVMLTGHTDFSLVKRAINEGSINYFVHKPVNSNKLRSIIGEAMIKYTENKQLATFLKNPEGLASAKSLITDVIGSKIKKNHLAQNKEFLGIVISKGSVPVYSHFYNEDILQGFTDTLFAGFMSALVMVGDEVFSMSNGMDSLKFGDITIIFRFFDVYQISFILHGKNEINKNVKHQLDIFTENIKNEIKSNSLFFSWFKDNDQIIEKYIIPLRAIVK